MKRLSLILSLLGGVAAGFATMAPAAAQTFPNRPVRIVVPYAPGGGADIVARILGEQLRKDTGQPFVVDNKPGAGGIVAIEDFARQKPDGYTIMIGNVSSNLLTPLLYPAKLRVDYAKAVVPLARLTDLPAVLAATTTGFAPKTLAEFIAFAKANPGKVRYGSAGIGSFPHFDAAIFAKRAGLDIIHIPNKDGAAGMNKDLATGDSQVGFINAGTAAPSIRAGNMRALAVVFDQRLPEFPDVPTLAEAGFPDVGTLQWIGAFAPANTPRPVLDALVTSFNKALAAEPVKQAFAKATYRVNPTASYDDAQTWFASETKRWKAIIEETKIEVNE